MNIGTFKTNYLGLKILTLKRTLWVSLFILGIRLFMYLTFPFVSTDGPWALSSVFSFMNGMPSYSFFAYEFLGSSFPVNSIDFLFSLWFSAFGISTTSFILLGFSAVILTIFLWLLIQKKISNPFLKKIVFTLVICYLLSPYTYGFRQETFTILLISIMFTSLIAINNTYIKFSFAVISAILAGLIHHIGGLFSIIFLTYYLIESKATFKHYIFLFISGALATAALSAGHIFEYLLLPTKIPSEVGNHFSSLHPELIIKYFILGAPVPFMICTILPIKNNKLAWFYLTLVLILFLVMGRSYYMPYIFTVILCQTIVDNIKQTNTTSNKPQILSKSLISLSIFYSFVAFLFLPFIFKIQSKTTGAHWEKILAAINLEEKDWNSDYKYYIPSQLSMEVIDNSRSRLLYSFIRHNEGIQEVNQKKFYIYKQSQKQWILENFNTKEQKMIFKELIPAFKGEIILSSINHFRAIRSDSIGLWSIVFE